MSLTIATAFTFSFLVTLIIANPTSRPSSEDADAGPATFTVTQIRLSPEQSSVRLEQCIRVQNSKVPTSLQIESEHLKLFSFKLIEYSNSNCQGDNNVIGTTHIPKNENGAVSQNINQRRPICSFSLGKEPFAEYPVTVNFLHSVIPKSSYEVPDTICHDLCGQHSSVMSRYPVQVELLEKDGVTVANNFVKLFSGNGCADGSEIRNSIGKVEIYNGVALQSLTQLESQATKSFAIAAISV